MRQRLLHLIHQNQAHLVGPDALEGSIALDGTSLTVNEVSANRFGVNLIPHSLTVTTWGSKKPGDVVNLEVDLIARYVARLLLGDAAAAPLHASIEGADDRLRALLERKGYV